MSKQQELVTLFFNRGAYVTYPNVPGEPQQAGYIDCEHSQRSQFYYVRNEATGLLDVVHWANMKLARRPDATHV